MLDIALESHVQINNHQVFPAHILYKFPGIARVSCLFCTGAAGNLSLDAATSEQEKKIVGEKRKDLASSYGFATWAEAFQVHGKRILLHALDAPCDMRPQLEADGLSTSNIGQALIIKTADCQPILLAHRSGEHLAALHVGWRGNANEFILSAVDEFCQAHAILPKDIFAVRGPSLGIAEFVNFEREWPEKFQPWYNAENATMDLWGLSRSQLVQAGLPDAQIFGLDFCTATHSPLFFSHRRGQSGRQLSLIWRTS